MIGTVIVIAAVLLSIRLVTAPRVVSGDTFWYARAALRFTGATEGASTDGAAAFMRDERGDEPDYWVGLVAEIDSRYGAIFASRPLYPLLAAPLLPLFGLSALIVVSVGAGIVCSAIAAVTAHHLWHSPVASIAAGILVVALPSGASIAFAYADGVMLAAWSATLALAGAYVRRGGRWRAAALRSVATLFMAKSANGMLLTLTIALLAAAATSYSRGGNECRRSRWQRSL